MRFFVLAATAASVLNHAFDHILHPIFRHVPFGNQALEDVAKRNA
jgi:hypothetical protein